VPDIGYNETNLISHTGDGARVFFENTIAWMGIQEIQLMGEQQKECRECGWRGSAAELDETSDAATGKTHIFCPACGGVTIEDLKADDQAQASES
jgi:hypothetical protein